MTDYTPNYGLVKPEEHEYYAVGIQNQNMDTIDAALEGKGNGAVWYATEVKQYDAFNHRIDLIVPGFVFTEGCTLIAKLPELDKSNITANTNWMIAIIDPSNGGGYRMLSGGGTSTNLVPRDFLQGNQIISVTLSKEIVDPLGAASGTAFLSALPISKKVYNIEQLGFKNSDFALDTVQSAIFKLIRALPTYGFLKIYLRGLQDPNVPEDRFYTLWNLINNKIILDTGHPATEWIIQIERGWGEGTPHKITVFINSYEGDRSVEFRTTYDNTLGTFKPVNVGSNKNLLPNWDFRNPANSRGNSSYTSPSNATTATPSINIWNLARARLTIEDGFVNVTTLPSATYKWIEATLFTKYMKLEIGKTYTFSVLMRVNSVSGNSNIGFLDSKHLFTSVAKLTETSGKFKLFSTTKTITSSFDLSTYWGVAIIATNTEDASFDVDICSTKVEQGNVSTLVNDPPVSYAEQALLCQHIDDFGTYSGRSPNKNLLHNWDFRNPVNQRGKSSYSGTVYTIDSWILGSQNVGASSISLHPEGIKVLKTDTGHTAFVQRIESNIWKELIGKSITISFLINDTIISHSFVVASSGYQTSPRINSYYAIGCETRPEYGYIQFVSYLMGDSDTLKLAKLEIGDISTLYNNTAPADYGEQLALCQRYQLKVYSSATLRASAVTANFIRFNMPVPQTLRANPTLAVGGVIVRSLSNATVSGFTFDFYQKHNSLEIQANKIAHGLSDAHLVFSDDANSLFDANL